MYNTISRFIFAVFLGAVLFPGVASAVSPINLVANANLEAQSGAVPTAWAVGFLPLGATTSYPVEGPSGAGDKAVRVEFTSYTSGDAKWVFPASTTTAGELYTFVDTYKSSRVSQIIAAFTYPDASQRFVPISILPSTGGVWKNASEQFTIQASPTAPAGPIMVTVYHVIDGVGYLVTDNYGLYKLADASVNVFSEGIVSLTFDDGWSSQYDVGTPILASAHLPGTFYVMSESTSQASLDYFVTQIGSITSIVTTNSVKWFEIYTDPSTHLYRFTDTSTSSSDTFVEMTYTTNGATTTTTQTFGPYSAGASKKIAINATLPGLQSGTPLIINHFSAGAISVGQHSLYPYGFGYMTLEQLLDLQTMGHEIGGHTRNHCNLVSLFGDATTAVSPDVCAFPLANSTPAFQIGQSDLRATLGSPLDTFAYPNGATNASIKSLVSGAGFGLARTVDIGYNTKVSDKLALKVQIVDASTTLPMVQSWVDTALLNKTWLILVFHQISDPLTLITNGEKGGTTPTMFQDIATLLTGKNVKTVHQVLSLMESTIVDPDLTAPVITLLGSSTMNLTVGTSFVDPGFTVVDNVDASINVAVSGVVNTSATGTYAVAYNAVDTAGNHALQKTRTVNVSSAPVVNQAPTITLLGVNAVSLTVGDSYTDAGATASDPEDGNISNKIIMTGSVNTNSAGSYTLHYNATDTQSLSAPEVTRTVTVSAPVVSSGGGGGGGGGATYYYSEIKINGGALQSSSTNVTLTLSASGLSQMWISNDAGFATGSWMPIQNSYPWTLTNSTGTKTVYARFGSASSTYATNQATIQLTQLTPVAPVAPVVTGGQVLGTSTTCTILLTQNLSMGNAKNTVEQVKALQHFLNTMQGEKLPETGYYGKMTRDAVKRFQMKYADLILKPIGLTLPTGNVGTATRKVINDLVCITK